MADPATMAAMSIGSTILGGLLSAKGASAGASSQAGGLQYQAALSLLNAQINEQNSNYAVQQGERQAAKYGLGARQQLAEIGAGQSASGLDVNSGSAVATRDSQHLVSIMDMDSIRADAAKTAYDYRTQAAADRAQAAGDMVAANRVRAAGPTSVAGSIVGTAGAVADKWLKGKEVGMWDNIGKLIPSLGA